MSGCDRHTGNVTRWSRCGIAAAILMCALSSDLTWPLAGAAVSQPPRHRRLLIRVGLPVDLARERVDADERAAVALEHLVLGPVLVSLSERSATVRADHADEGPRLAFVGEGFPDTPQSETRWDSMY